MKEATGELNMTVVTVVAIAAVGAFFTLIIWPRIKATIDRNTNCANAICQAANCNGDTCNCTYIDESNNPQPIVCPDEND